MAKHFAITRHAAPAHHRPAGAGDCWRVISKNDRNLSRLGSSDDSQRYAPGEGVKMNNVGLFFIQDLVELARCELVALAVKFREFGNPAGNREPSNSHSVSFIRFRQVTWRSDQN